MRICATVEVSNRNLPSLNISQKRPERSHLSIGITPGKNKETFLLHQTQRNFAGVRYKIKGNIDTVFTRFAADGKATVRMINPPHDLIIKSSPNDLKTFLKTLKLTMDENFDPNLDSCKLEDIGCTPKKVPPKPKTRCVITSKADFPTLEGFPRATNFLQVNDVGMKRLDTRILRLQYLKVLNLEGNLLETLPEQIDLLPSLKELHLAKNCFGSSKDWGWITGKSIRKNLMLLDLRHNQLSILPKAVCKLKNLKILLIGKNSLKAIPNGIGNLKNLQTLDASSNLLYYLPGSILLLKMSFLDVSGNSDINQQDEIDFGPPSSVFPTLLDLSASAVLSNRCDITDDCLPRSLISYLEDASYCLCGEPTFPTSSQFYVPFLIKRLAIQVTLSTPEFYISFRHCSLKCLLKHPTSAIPNRIL